MHDMIATVHITSIDMIATVHIISIDMIASVYITCIDMIATVYITCIDKIASVYITVTKCTTICCLLVSSLYRSSMVIYQFPIHTLCWEFSAIGLLCNKTNRIIAVNFAVFREINQQFK